MGRRVTVADVAKHAGVSVATVDRVLNRRRAVRKETADAVLAAAEALDYYAVPLMRRRLSAVRRPVSIGFILQKETKSFYRALASALEQEVHRQAGVSGGADYRFVDALSPRDITRELRDLGAKVDAIGMVTIDHPHISDEVLRLRGKGVSVVTLLSGLSTPAAIGHVGADSRRAGRTAAWAIARCVRGDGPIAVLVGSHRYMSHEDREIGFRSYFRERSHGARILESAAYLDDDPGAYEALLEIAKRHRDLAGVYLVGGGTVGAMRALQEESWPHRISFVCHQLDSETRDGLLDGVVDLVIDTPVERIAQSSVARLLGAGTREAAATDIDLVPFNIYVSENV